MLRVRLQAAVALLSLTCLGGCCRSGNNEGLLGRFMNRNRNECVQPYAYQPQMAAPACGSSVGAGYGMPYSGHGYDPSMGITGMHGGGMYPGGFGEMSVPFSSTPFNFGGGMCMGGMCGAPGMDGPYLGGDFGYGHGIPNVIPHGNGGSAPCPNLMPQPTVPPLSPAPGGRIEPRPASAPTEAFRP